MTKKEFSALMKIKRATLKDLNRQVKLLKEQYMEENCPVKVGDKVKITTDCKWHNENGEARVTYIVLSNAGNFTYTFEPYKHGKVLTMERISE